MIFPFVGTPTIYHCPTDHSTVADQPKLRRFRTYVLNGWVKDAGDKGTAYGYSWDSSGGPIPTRYSGFSQTSLSALFTFIDENEQSIDDGSFFSILDEDRWFDLPTDRHNRGCNLSFLDGHAEHWRWKAPKVFRRYGDPPANNLDKADLHRLHAAFPVEK